jgi:hypothetical protein
VIIELTGLNKRLDLNVEIPKEEEEAKPIVPEEAFTITGDCSYRFGYGGWDWFIDDFGDRVITDNITNTTSMFQKCKVKKIPFEINVTENCESFSNFITWAYLEELPKIVCKEGKSCPNIGTMIYGLERFNKPVTLNDFDWFDFEKAHTDSNKGMSNMFAYCYSLRTIEEDFMKEFWVCDRAGGSNASTRGLCQYCHGLDEIKGVYPSPIVTTSTLFSNFLYSCGRVKEVIFATDNGNPYKRQWSKQSIDLKYISTVTKSQIATYSEYSKIGLDTEITNQESYERLKNNKDSWTQKKEYSRYNKKSALNTIKSLPDCSSGSNNTITFDGNAGSLTDEGAINTLTQEEIAIASAKGWTVAFS